ncbi:hypothetical protein CRE_04250 [Caenorhabditis remanei]|uniref:F-box associated domain-containing protein n=1 Tax=Caenorhabditis remanei TaxID=31234 RepID=E3MYY5_CAERE|nr:hypothetical protein CRE_04250 [Caenorhabditis remanei]
MDSTEKLLLSLASKKAAYVMRSVLPQNSVKLQITFSEITDIIIETRTEKTCWTLLKIFNSSKTPVFKLSGDVIFQWEGPNFELNGSVKSLISHFAIAFHPTIAMLFGHGCREDFMMEMMNHVKELNLAKTSLEISMSSLSPANYKFVLDECNQVSKLRLFCKIAPEFQFRAGPDFKVEELVVGDGHWMHLEDFSNCKKVTVLNCTGHKQPKYADPEMTRALIRKWIESEEDDCVLEHLEICSDPNDFGSVLAGLEYTTIELTAKLETVEITRRSDEKKAVVKCGEKMFQFNVIID